MKWLALIVAACCAAAAPARADEAAAMSDVVVYKPAGQIASVAVFLSGDGGWELGVIPMAKKLLEQDALVIGMSTPKILKGLQAGSGTCIDPAAEILSVARKVMADNGAPAKMAPILIGYSSGADLAYTSLIQAKPGAFGGGIGLGFCPDLETHKPLCPGAQGLTYTRNTKGPGFIYDTVKKLSDPFIAMQGGKDQVCDPIATDKFITAIKGAKIIDLPNVGHGFSVPKNWMPQYAEAYRSLANGTAR